MPPAVQSRGASAMRTSTDEGGEGREQNTPDALTPPPPTHTHKPPPTHAHTLILRVLQNLADVRDLRKTGGKRFEALQMIDLKQAAGFPLVKTTCLDGADMNLPYACSENRATLVVVGMRGAADEMLAAYRQAFEHSKAGRSPQTRIIEVRAAGRACGVTVCRWRGTGALARARARASVRLAPLTWRQAGERQRADTRAPWPQWRMRSS